jgi:hypothetical protein
MVQWLGFSLPKGTVRVRFSVRVPLIFFSFFETKDAVVNQNEGKGRFRSGMGKKDLSLARALARINHSSECPPFSRVKQHFYMLVAAVEDGGKKNAMMVGEWGSEVEQQKKIYEL